MLATLLVSAAHMCCCDVAMRKQMLYCSKVCVCDVPHAVLFESVALYIRCTTCCVIVLLTARSCAMKPTVQLSVAMTRSLKNVHLQHATAHCGTVLTSTKPLSP
jgi:hypothetical protein